MGSEMCIRDSTNWGAIVGLVAGTLTVFIWGNIESLHSTMYEIVPGFIVNFILSIVVSLVTYKPNAEIEAEFDAAVHAVKTR